MANVKVKTKSGKKIKAIDVIVKPWIEALQSIQSNIKKGNPVPTGWVQGWISTSARNGSRGNEYQGFNQFILSFFKDECWFTYNQVVQLGGNIRKGGKSVPICWWNMF